MEDKIDRIVKDFYFLMEMKLCKKEFYPSYQRILKRLALEQEKKLFYAKMIIKHQYFKKESMIPYEFLYSIIKDIDCIKRESFIY